MTQAMTDQPLAYHSPIAVPYATPAGRPGGPRAWAGAAILVGGLALVLLGGCFLIGVLGLVQPSAFNGGAAPHRLTEPELGLMIVLYVLAFASFGGAATLLFVGTRALLRLLQN